VIAFPHNVNEHVRRLWPLIHVGMTSSVMCSTAGLALQQRKGLEIFRPMRRMNLTGISVSRCICVSPGAAPRNIYSLERRIEHRHAISYLSYILRTPKVARLAAEPLQHTQTEITLIMEYKRGGRGAPNGDGERKGILADSASLRSACDRIALVWSGARRAILQTPDSHTGVIRRESAIRLRPDPGFWLAPPWSVNLH